MAEKRFSVTGHSTSQCQGVINYTTGGLSGNYPNIEFTVTVKAGWYSHVAGHGINFDGSYFKWTGETKKVDVNWRSSSAGYSPWYALKTYTYELGTAKKVSKGISLSVTTYTPYNFNGSITVSSASVEAPLDYGLSISGITEKSIVINHTLINKRNYWRVRLKDTISGKMWALNSNTGNGSTIITGLTANTIYNFVIQVIDRTDAVCYTSIGKSAKTLGISIVGNSPIVTLGNSFVLTINGYSESFNHDVVFTVGTFNFSRRGLSRGNVPITLTEEEIDIIYSLMPTVKSLSMSITLSTYAGDSLIGSYKGKGTIQINTVDSTPTMDSFDYLDTIADAIAITGNYRHVIQNISKISIHSINATAKKYATITQYRLVVGSRTITSIDTIIEDTGVILSNTGITVQVIDSRGLIGSKTIQFDKYYSYAIPMLRTLSTRRKNSIERAIYLSFNGIFTQLNVDGDVRNNICNVSWCYKKTSDTEFTSYKTIGSFTNGEINFNNIVGELDDEYSFNIRVMLHDSLTSSILDVVVSKGISDFCIGKNQASFGKPLEVKNLLDVAWPIKTPSIEIENGISGNGFRCGFVNITPKANAPTFVHVNAVFAKTPRVCVSAVSSVPGTTVLGVSAGNVDQSGFDIFVTRTNTTVTMIAWIAACEV